MFPQEIGDGVTRRRLLQRVRLQTELPQSVDQVERQLLPISYELDHALPLSIDDRRKAQEEIVDVIQITACANGRGHQVNLCRRDFVRPTTRADKFSLPVKQPHATRRPKVDVAEVNAAQSEP